MPRPDRRPCEPPIRESAPRPRWAPGRSIAHLLALLGLDVLIFQSHYFGGTSFPFDFGATYYALPAYWIASVTGGEWPGWVPYLGMGYPFAAHPQSAAFYPPLWLFPLLHVPYTLAAATALQALHVFGGAVGAYVLVRRLVRSAPAAFVAGACYLAYGGFYSNAGHPDIVRGFALTPWLLWAMWLPPPGARITDGASPRRLFRPAWPLLTLPAITYLFVTGVYVGQTIAVFLVALPPFLLLQAIRNHSLGQPIRSAILDLVPVGALVAIGIGLASAFLVPLLALSGELTRSTDYLSNARWYLQLRDLYELVLSSPELRPKDHSMYAMQVSLVLLPFLTLVGRWEARQLIPLAGLVGAALLMSLEPLSGVSSALARLVPYLGYSRFPVGDYRTLLALSVLVACSAGLARGVSQRRVPSRTLALRYVLGLGAIAASVLPVLGAIDDPAMHADAVVVVILQFVPAVVLCALLFRATRPWSLAKLLPAAIAGLCVLSAAPVLFDMQAWWRAPASEEARTRDSGVSPWSDGAWRADTVYQERRTTRPERQHGDNPYAIAWRGYLAGEYMANDYGGAVLKARQNVEQDVALRSFMQRETTLVALPCIDRCPEALSPQAGLEGEGVLTFPDFQWQANGYGRSSIEYHVSLSQPALVIENELFSRGWTGVLTGPGAELPLAPVAVNGALRGWVLPAGDYDLRVTYHTPLLGIGLVLSSAALLGYLTLLVIALANTRELRAKGYTFMRGTCALREATAGESRYRQTVVAERSAAADSC